MTLMQVGKEIKGKAHAQQEMKDIASNEHNVFFVDDYNALNTILDQLATNIFTRIEGELTVFYSV